MNLEEACQSQRFNGPVKSYFIIGSSEKWNYMREESHR
jgi:hypothetical protein